MIPVKTESTNMNLVAPDCYDLPVRVYANQEMKTAVFESCWELTDEEIAAIVEHKCIYLTIVGTRHPPVRLSTVPEPVLDNMIERVNDADT